MSWIEVIGYAFQQPTEPVFDKAIERKKSRMLTVYAGVISKIITAIGNFSVQYNFQCIAVALLVMSASVCTADDADCKDNTQASWVASTQSVIMFVGAIAGQLSMGYIGDLIGRNYALFLTLSLLTIGSFGSAVFAWGSPTDVYTIIIVFRFILGFGAGGVYPLSATKAAEDGGIQLRISVDDENLLQRLTHSDFTGNKSHNVKSIEAAKAFFWQPVGALGPWFLGYLCVVGGMNDRTMWRFLLGFGSVPAFIVLAITYIEIKMRDAADAYKRRGNDLREQEEEPVRTLSQAEKDSEERIRSELMMKYRSKLLVTGGGWFIYDVAYYGILLGGGDIVNSMKTTDDDNVSSSGSLRYATGMEAIALFTGIPSALLTIYLMQRYGTKMVQVGGFLFQGVCFIVMAATFFPLKQDHADVLFFFYCCLLFSLIGFTGMTTFVLSAETFPKEIRGTYNGISAACGKIGAAVGGYLFASLVNYTTYPAILLICAGIVLAGAVISYVQIPDREMTRTPSTEKLNTLTHSNVTNHLSVSNSM